MKRIFDIVFALLGLLLLSPAILIIAIGIRLSSPGPVFYRGVRVGRDGRLFRILKFRTMVADADRLGGPSAGDDDPRITRFGLFLRRYKLDEVPQTFQVLTGEMSFVGPRPEVPLEVDLYTPEERGLLSVRPGITDWASIRFRDEGEVLRGSVDAHAAYRKLIRPEKMRLGLEYVRRHSFWIDLKILLVTAWVLAGGSRKAVAELRVTREDLRP